MKSNKTGAIFNPWASTQFMMVFLARNGGYAPSTGATDKSAPQNGGVHGPFSAKAGAMRRPLAALDCP
jgi:hypothetical protein